MTTMSNSQALWIISLLITIFSLSIPAFAQYSVGMGEPNDPYYIARKEDFILFGDRPKDYHKHFILTTDLDLNPNLSGRNVFDRSSLNLSAASSTVASI